MHDRVHRAAKVAWNWHCHLMATDPLYPVVIAAIAEMLTTRRVNLARLAATIAAALTRYLHTPWDDLDEWSGYSY